MLQLQSEQTAGVRVMRGRQMPVLSLGNVLDAQLAGHFVNTVFLACCVKYGLHRNPPLSAFGLIPSPQFGHHLCMIS